MGSGQVQGKIIRFQVRSRDGRTTLNVRRAYAVPDLQVSHLNYDPEQLQRLHLHLQGIELPKINVYDITILIGSDVSEAHRELESLYSAHSDPLLSPSAINLDSATPLLLAGRCSYY